MSPQKERGRIGRAINTIRTEPGLLRNVIAILVVVVLGLGIGGTVLANQRFNPPWESRGYYWATFADASSVAPGLGQSVMINGVQVGQIQDAKIDNKGEALVLMSINRSQYDRPIYRNATVVMRPTTPLNTMYVELSPGSQPAPELPEYGVLPLGASTSPIEIDQPLGHLDENTRGALRELLSQTDTALANAGTDVPAFLSSTDNTVKALTPVVQQLDARRAKIQQLISSVAQISQTVGGNDVRLAQLADNLQVTLKATADQSENIKNSFNQLPGVTDKLKAATGSIQGLSDQLDPTLNDIREASKTLPDSLSRLTDTVDTLDTTLDKAQPVAQKLRPVSADLRPVVDDINRTTPDLKAIVRQLEPITSTLLPYLPDLTAFTYQSRSITDKGSADLRNSLRALVQAGPTTIPSGATAGQSGIAQCVLNALTSGGNPATCTAGAGARAAAPTAPVPGGVASPVGATPSLPTPAAAATTR